MRILELLFTISLFFFSVLTLFVSHKIKLLIKPQCMMYSLYGSAVILAILSISMEGYRFIMLPLYLLCIILCVIGVTRRLRYKAYKASQAGEQQITIMRNSKRKHCFLRVFGITVFYAVFLISILLAELLPVKNLPKPSGDSKVGTVIMDFTNPSRTNLLTESKESKKIAVQIWYPASDILGKKRANWMMNRQIAALFAKREGLPDLFGQLCLVKTNSYLNAPISMVAVKYPIIMFSGGGGMFNGQNVIQMEELASQGFVIAAVSHPEDDFATTYSNGTVLPYDMQLSKALSDDMKQAITYMKSKYSSEDASPKVQRDTLNAAKLSNKNARLWAEDIIFVANQLEELNNGSIKSMFEGRLDTKQIGVFGHSFGGAAAGQACLTDNRFKAFINMDGSPFGDAGNQIIKQPFMVIATGADSSLKFRACDGYAPDQRNFLIVSVSGTEHMNFTDLNTVISRLGKITKVLGSIETKEQTKIMNTYVLAFFNHYLKGSAEPILESEQAPFPEVSFIKR